MSAKAIKTVATKLAYPAVTAGLTVLTLEGQKKVRSWWAARKAKKAAEDKKTAKAA